MTQRAIIRVAIRNQVCKLPDDETIHSNISHRLQHCHVSRFVINHAKLELVIEMRSFVADNERANFNQSQLLHALVYVGCSKIWHERKWYLLMLATNVYIYEPS